MIPVAGFVTPAQILEEDPTSVNRALQPNMIWEPVLKSFPYLTPLATVGGVSQAPPHDGASPSHVLSA